MQLILLFQHLCVPSAWTDFHTEHTNIMANFFFFYIAGQIKHFSNHLVNTTCLSHVAKTPQTAQLPPHISIHSSHAYGRKATWADWFTIPRSAEGLVTGCQHERDTVWVMTHLSFESESNLVNVCCNHLTKVKVGALLHFWDFLPGFPFTFTSLCYARPYMLLWNLCNPETSPN